MRRTSQGWQHPLFIRLTMFCLLFGFWLILSGEFYPEFIAAGALASAGVVLVAGHLVHRSAAEHYEELPQSFRWLAITVVRFLAYLPWLTKEIAIANLQVTYQVLHPSLPISPRLMRFRTALRTEPSLLLFAHSITLTPGTITVNLDKNEFVIHALSHASVQAVEEGRMQHRIARTFGEGDLPEFVSMEVIHAQELRR